MSPRNRASQWDAMDYTYTDPTRIPMEGSFLIESHQPHVFKRPYHHHTSIEVNFLTGAEMVYSFSGAHITIPPEQMAIFWGAAPHRVIEVRGEGKIINIYLTFSQVIQWGLPGAFIESLVSHNILTSTEKDSTDEAIFTRWARDYHHTEHDWRWLILREIELRFHRLCLEGWVAIEKQSKINNEKTNLHSQRETDPARMRGRTMRHVEDMLSFIAQNHTRPLRISDVAEHVHLSPNHATTLFRQVIGIPIKTHLTHLRLTHARMLLAESQKKILTIAMDSGFSSLSSFYAAFEAHYHQPPAAFRRKAHQGNTSSNRQDDLKDIPLV
ncbi:MAG: helix-turn-helix domain-containing protein [Pseudomonadota bacterium]